MKAAEPEKTYNWTWYPQPVQRKFMARREYECLYGGAAGGGKTDALLAEVTRQIDIPHYRAILFRDTVPQLEGMISRSQELYKSAFPRAKYNSTKMWWTFPNGAKIMFGHMQREEDKLQYQGKSYDFIGFDELTHFSQTQYMYLMSRNRPTGPGTRVYIRATCNPGGKYGNWVKQRFITPSPPATPIKSEYEVITPSGEVIKQTKHRIFIPATVFDNKKLLENDPSYLANLAMLPEAEKNALLYGSWDSFEGQVFTEWKNDPAHYKDRRWTHVIDPFPIPKHWQIYRGYDFGYAKPFSVGWYAVDTAGKMYRIREYYGCVKDQPNTGIKIDPVQQAREIARIEREDPALKNKKIIGIADPSIWDESRGESIAHMMESSPNFIYFRHGDNTRLAGKMQFHYRLAFDSEGDPMFQVFNTCRNFIETIPMLTYSQTHPEDIDTEQEDHIYDECRYVMMDRPITPRKNEAAPVPKDDPLNLYEHDQPVRFYNV